MPNFYLIASINFFKYVLKTNNIIVSTKRLQKHAAVYFSS